MYLCADSTAQRRITQKAQAQEGDINKQKAHAQIDQIS
jgi:hypothetical protein